MSFGIKKFWRSSPKPMQGAHGKDTNQLPTRPSGQQGTAAPGARPPRTSGQPGQAWVPPNPPIGHPGRYSANTPMPGAATRTDRFSNQGNQGGVPGGNQGGVNQPFGRYTGNTPAPGTATRPPNPQPSASGEQTQGRFTNLYSGGYGPNTQLRVTNPDPRSQDILSLPSQRPNHAPLPNSTLPPPATATPPPSSAASNNPPSPNLYSGSGWGSPIPSEGSYN